MIEIKISIEAQALAEAVTRLAAALEKHDKPAIHITGATAEARGAELVTPAGATFTATDADDSTVTLEPEKPKRGRRKRAETPQEPAVEPEAPAAVEVPAEPENAQESAQEPPVSDPEPAPAEPEKPAPTLDQIANAGAALLESDIDTMMPKLLGLLQDFGVQAITQLKPEQLSDFAERLRALGAEV